MQSALLGLALIGAVVLIVKRVYWPVAVWLLLVIAIVHSSKPFGGFVGHAVALFSDAFYSDPRRLSAIVCLLLAPTAGIGLFALAAAAGHTETGTQDAGRFALDAGGRCDRVGRDLRFLCPALLPAA